MGIPNDLPRAKEVNVDAVMHHPTREDAHHLQSVEEIRALLPNQDATAHVHHLELDSAAMTEMARPACHHHAVDVPLHSPKIDR
jgi:hypothetical protein